MKLIKIGLHGEDCCYVERVVTDVMYLYLKGIETDFEQGKHPCYSPTMSIEVIEEDYKENNNE